MTKRNSTYNPIAILYIFWNGKQYYVEQSQVVGGNQFVAARPVDENFIKEVFTHFKIEVDKIHFGGYVPPNVIGYTDKLTYNSIIWRSERGPRTLLFKTGENIPDGKYYVPGLVWIFGKSLGLYAYEEWKGEKTKLYYPPFYNCSHEDVCLGTASAYINSQKNKYTFTDIINTVENAFWKSRFTHAGSQGNINGNFKALFQKTMGADSYPYEYLIPAKKTVEDVCNADYNT